MNLPVNGKQTYGGKREMANFLDVLKGLDKGDKLSLELDKNKEGYGKLVLHDYSAQVGVTRDIVVFDLERGTFAYADSNDQAWNGLLEDIRKLQGTEPEIKTGLAPKEENYGLDSLIKLIKLHGKFTDDTLEFPISTRIALALALVHGEEAFKILTEDTTISKKEFYITDNLADRMTDMLAPSGWSLSHSKEALKDVAGSHKMELSFKLLENFVTFSTKNDLPLDFLSGVLNSTKLENTADCVHHLVTAETYAITTNKEITLEVREKLADYLGDILINWASVFIGGLLVEEESEEGKKDIIDRLDELAMDTFDVLMVHFGTPLLHTVGLASHAQEISSLATASVYEVYNEKMIAKEQGVPLTEEEINTLSDLTDAFDTEEEELELESDIDELALQEEARAKFENENEEVLVEVKASLAESKKLTTLATDMLSGMSSDLKETTTFNMVAYAVSSADRVIKNIDVTPHNEESLETVIDSLDRLKENEEAEFHALIKAKRSSQNLSTLAIEDTLKRILTSMEVELEEVMEKNDPNKTMFYYGSINMLEELLNLGKESVSPNWKHLATYLILSIELGYKHCGIRTAPLKIEANPAPKVKEVPQLTETEREASKAIVNFLQGLLDSIEDEEEEEEEVPVVEDEEEEVTPEELKEEKLLKEWGHGVPLYELTEKYGVSVGAIYSILYAHGADVKSSKVASRVAHVETNSKVLAEVLEAYEQGKRLADIYEEYDLHKNGLFYLLDKYRVPRRGHKK